MPTPWIVEPLDVVEHIGSGTEFLHDDRVRQAYMGL